MNSLQDRSRENGKRLESESEIAALREFVNEIAEGGAFKGSNRCGKFLKYIVDQTIAGRSNSLKERVIGVEVFGREPTYDTSEDAIVRVTASDVRKRLLRHYGRNGLASPFHISLPVGSYIPEITCDSQIIAAQPNAPQSTQHLQSSFPTPTAFERSLDLVPAGLAPGVATSPAPSPTRRFSRLWIAFALFVASINLALLGIAWKRGPISSSQASEVRVAPGSTLPWSAFFGNNHVTHLITSDGDIVRIQRFVGKRISVSDYANQKYVSDGTTLSPEMKRMFLTMMQGDRAPLLDTQIVARAAAVAASNSKDLDVRGARGLQFADLRSDDNFIFLGSPYSDPWFSVFNEQLDFRILSRDDKDLGPEFISNVHPKPNEQVTYRPTAKGGATGETYGILGFVGNPNQNGEVLLLAGISGEGTQAAGELATDLPSLSRAMRNCGIPPSGPIKHFEMLLRVKIMAGYPSQFDVAACHIIP